MSDDQPRIHQGLQRVLDGARAAHFGAFGKVRVAEQPMRVPRDEEHDGQTQFLPEDDLRKAPHRVIHGYRRHGSTIALFSITGNGNLVT